jgi:hypothetical protein
LPEVRQETVRILKDWCKHTDSLTAIDRKAYETLNTNEELVVLVVGKGNVPMVLSTVDCKGTSSPQNVEEGIYLVPGAQELSSPEKYLNFGDLSANSAAVFEATETLWTPEINRKWVPLRHILSTYRFAKYLAGLLSCLISKSPPYVKNYAIVCALHCLRAGPQVAMVSFDAVLFSSRVPKKESRNLLGLH